MQRFAFPARSRRRMEANLLRSIPGSAEEAETAASFEDFYEATSHRLFTALCLVTGSRHEAEEIAQEGFTRVFERWDRVGARGSDGIPVPRLDERVPQPLPKSIARPSPRGLPRAFAHR